MFLVFSTGLHQKVGTATLQEHHFWARFMSPRVHWVKATEGKISLKKSFLLISIKWGQGNNSRKWEKQAHSYQKINCDHIDLSANALKSGVQKDRISCADYITIANFSCVLVKVPVRSEIYSLIHCFYLYKWRLRRLMYKCLPIMSAKKDRPVASVLTSYLLIASVRKREKQQQQ